MRPGLVVERGDAGGESLDSGALVWSRYVYSSLGVAPHITTDSTVMLRLPDTTSARTGSVRSLTHV